MSGRHVGARAGGFAFLELSMASLVLLPILVVITVTTQFVGLMMRMTAAIESTVRTDRAVHVDTTLSSTGTTLFSIDYIALDGEVERLLAMLKENLNLAQPESYRIEGGIALLRIDAVSGAPNLDTIEYRGLSQGTLACDHQVLSDVALRDLIERFIGAPLAHTRSLVAREIPGGSRYLELAPLLVLRLSRAVEGRWAARVLEMIGLKRYVTAVHIAPVRTEVGI